MNLTNLQSLATSCRELQDPCRLCVRRCGAHRLQGEPGVCGLAAGAHVYHHELVMGEELALVPSYLVFLRGCNLACSFCSEEPRLPIPPAETPTQPSAFAETLASRLARKPRARNLNFVGGEPSLSLAFVAELAVALGERGVNAPPFLLNSNGLFTPEAAELAARLFPLFVIDLKFGNDGCARAIAGYAPYLEPLRANLRSLARSTHGVRLFLRHLAMPGHLDCCLVPTLRWLGDELPELPINVMSNLARLPDTRAASWPEASKAEHEAIREALRAARSHHKLLDGGPFIA